MVVEGADLADEAPVEGVLAAQDPFGSGSGGTSPLAPVARLRGLRWRHLRLWSVSPLAPTTGESRVLGFVMGNGDRGGRGPTGIGLTEFYP
jgi:hypothetical protein